MSIGLDQLLEYQMNTMINLDFYTISAANPVSAAGRGRKNSLATRKSI
jgi:hypothetical protein